ncbi:hypothetical protein G9A89_002213 [Geosiphon pyriformis]|nr:hypothetical protein G9A89_002213 [Geosiphon pyriformis]
MEILTIDGGLMEGGGQVVRNAVAFSCLLKKPIKIENIRAKREKPGLKPQHVSGLKLMGEIFQANVIGDEIGSNQIFFEPREVAEKKTFIADTKTAGSITLLIQVSLPPLFLSAPASMKAFALPPEAVKLILRGGTSVDAAPPIDYLIEVFRPIVQREFGLDFQVEIISRGYYPKGGGEVMVRVEPLVKKTLTPINMIERGDIVSIIGRVTIANVSKQVATKIIAGATKILNNANFKGDSGTTIKPQIEIKSEKIIRGKGFELVLWLVTSTGCILGGHAISDRGSTPEQVGENAAEELIRNWKRGGCVDEYLEDQLIIFMTLAKGKSQLLTGSPTLHTRTAIHYAQLISGVQFEVRKITDSQHGEEDFNNVEDINDAFTTYLIECEGLGLMS